jgi:hypothetical protein
MFKDKHLDSKETVGENHQVASLEEAMLPQAKTLLRICRHIRGQFRFLMFRLKASPTR